VNKIPQVIVGACALVVALAAVYGFVIRPQIDARAKQAIIDTCLAEKKKATEGKKIIEPVGESFIDAFAYAQTARSEAAYKSCMRSHGFEN
jgi:hypothetical protein